MSGQGEFASAADVALVVGGEIHRGWRSMKASLSLDAPAAKFSLELAERWSEAEDALPRTVKPGAACQLTLDDELVVDGWIDAVEASYDPRDHSLVVVARDRIGDMVDCAAVVDGAHEWRDVSLAEVARRLAEPYGVRVVAEYDAQPAFRRFALQPGETAWEALDRAARARGVLLAGDGIGGLRLTRSSLAPPAAGLIVAGENVLRCQGRFDHSGRFSSVCVRGQAEGQRPADGVYAADGALAPGAERTIAARGEARATDPAIARPRPRVVVSEAAGQGPSFADRATFEVRQAAGRGTRISYVLAGWRGSDGGLWRTNTRVSVQDRFLGIDQEMLVSGVVYSLTPGGGSVTEIEVTLPDAYDVQREPLKDEAGAGNGLLDGAVYIDDPVGSGRFRRASEAELAGGRA
jgi:prophage tail gpP-like protein